MFSSKFFRVSSSTILLILVIIGQVLVRPMPGEISINPRVLTDDGVWYSIKSLIFSGEEKQEAADKTISWWNQYREMYNPEFKEINVVYDLDVTDKFFGHRIIYPAATAYFVSVFDFFGLLVIPILAFSGIWLLLSLLLFKNRPVGYFIPLFILAGSSHYVGNAISTAGTDIILAFLIFLFVFSFIRFRRNNIQVIILLNLIIFLGNFTRPSLIYWILLCLCAIFIQYVDKTYSRLRQLLLGSTYLLNNLACYLYIENKWQSFSIIQSFDYYPRNIEIDTFIRRAISSFFSDGVTILAKDFNLLLLCILAALYATTLTLRFIQNHFGKLKPKPINFDDDIQFIIFTFAVIVAVLTPIIFTGIAGIRLRFYLPLFPLITYLAARQLEKSTK